MKLVWTREERLSTYSHSSLVWRGGLRVRQLALPQLALTVGSYLGGNLGV
jgi:hypothetical protein